MSLIIQIEEEKNTQVTDNRNQGENMNSNNLDLKQPETENVQLKVQKMKFGIISNFKSQASKRNLWLFTLDSQN